MRNKRGQAALEFLTTYGWAFLVILVMIGALAYFGVLDPSRFTPQRCQVGVPFNCDGENYVLQNDGAGIEEFRLRIRNTLNSAYFISAVQVKDGTGAFLDCDPAFISTIDPIPVDGFTDITCPLSGAASPVTIDDAGTKQRIQFQIVYYDSDPTFSKSVPGEIYANVVQ